MPRRSAAVLLSAGMVALVLGACGTDPVAEPALTNPGSAPAPSAAPATEAPASSSSLASQVAVEDGCADVIDATIEVRDGIADVTATVRSADTGWDKYADRWEVRTEDGTVLGERILTHPHENEQPFTRSLRGVPIPARVTVVVLAAHDSVEGFCGETFTLDIGAGS